MPDVVTKQTIKEARASFKARGRPALTEKEQRQLERSIQLEQRAERIKEAEKRRLGWAKKRPGQELRGKGGQQQQQQQVQLGSQRRCDRFGYKSSQFHLGAFFGTNPAAGKTTDSVDAVLQDGGDDSDDGDAFSDDDLDDDLLLALSGPMENNIPGERRRELLITTVGLMPPPPPPSPTPFPPTAARPCPRKLPLARVEEDLSLFFDALDSSTQIARELGSDHGDSGTASRLRQDSFGSDSFDLTEEDLNMLDPPNIDPTRVSTATADSQEAMAPPLLKPKSLLAPPQTNATTPTARTGSTKRSEMPAPLRSTMQTSIRSPVAAIRGPFLPASSLYCSPELGFTSTQLESFIDEDIQLTQIPG